MNLESLQDDFLIPPISLQLLLENAVKHNEFSASLPLELVCHFSSGKLYVENAIHPKSTRKPSSQVGLINLEERYRLITGQGIVVTKTQTHFKVELPLLKNI
jgi:LytS/YehU family sensor histidine kinase